MSKSIYRGMTPGEQERFTDRMHQISGMDQSRSELRDFETELRDHIRGTKAGSKNRQTLQTLNYRLTEVSLAQKHVRNQMKLLNIRP